MYILNIIVSNSQRHTKPVYNPYKDSLDNILNSNVDNIVFITVYIKPGPLKQGILITQPYMPQDINVL